MAFDTRFFICDNCGFVQRRQGTSRSFLSNLLFPGGITDSIMEKFRLSKKPKGCPNCKRVGTMVKMQSVAGKNFVKSLARSTQGSQQILAFLKKCLPLSYSIGFPIGPEHAKWYRLAEELAAWGCFDAALLCIEQARKLSSDWSGSTFLFEGSLRENVGQYDMALGCYRKAAGDRDYAWEATRREKKLLKKKESMANG